MLLRDALEARGRPARLEPAWVRPGGAGLDAALCALGVAGSIVAASGAPAVGLGLLVAALIALAGDLGEVLPVARLLLPRRATQCVVCEPPHLAPGAAVRLIVTAPLDSVPGDIARRLEPLEAAARRALGGHLPSAAALLVAALVALCALAAARVAGVDGAWWGPVALVPTLGLLVGAAAYVDLAVARPPAGVADRAAGAAAVAVALVDELDRRPARAPAFAVELVLAGASGPGGLGLRAYVRARRRRARPEELAVLAIAPCGTGPPAVHRTEGRLWPRRLHPAMIAAAAAAGAEHQRRGRSDALAARLARWPALGVGELAPRHPATALDPAALDAVLEVGLIAVTRLDHQVRR